MLRLFRKRTIWLPTWPTLLIAALSLGLVAWFLLANIHSFLSVTERAQGAKILVIEGWVSDAVLAQVFENFEPGQPYDYVCTTGGNLELGHYLSDLKTYADLSARTIGKLGVPPENIIIAPPQAAARDRTYHSALGFKEKRDASEIAVLRDADAIDVLSTGVHGRRTRIVFQKVLGDAVDVGIISPDSPDYDPDYWFTSSEGFKAVVMETIALGYEWLVKKDR